MNQFNADKLKLNTKNTVLQKAEKERQEKATGIKAPVVTVKRSEPVRTETAYQRITAKPEPEKKWYKGETPTSSEILAKIYSVGQKDEAQGRQLYSYYENAVKDKASPIYNPYTASTSNAAAELAKMGFDMTDGDAFIDNNAWLKNHYRLGTGGSPLAPSGSSTAEQNAAYWYYKYMDDEATTKQAEAEWEALQEEVAYWAGRKDRNYSDEEVLSKIDWSNYKTLAKMDEGKAAGLPVSLTRPVGYSKDALSGVIWGARNGQTGDATTNSVKAALGEGESYHRDDTISARLNPNDKENYNPYAVGSTIDEAALYFGKDSFDQEWLDNNNWATAGTDETAKKHYAKVKAAEATTQKAEEELNELWDDIRDDLTYSSDPEAIIDDFKQKIDDEERNLYPTLRKMMESLETGDILPTTRAIDFDWKTIENGIRAQCAAENLAKQPTEFVSNLANMLFENTADVMFGRNKTTAVEPTVKPSATATPAAAPAPRYETDEAVQRSRDNAINAAGMTIKNIGTGAEKVAFAMGYSADAEKYTNALKSAVYQVQTEPKGINRVLTQSADAAAVKGYGKVYGTIYDYEQKQQQTAEDNRRSEQAIAEAEKKLASAPVVDIDGVKVWYYRYNPETQTFDYDYSDMMDFVPEEVKAEAARIAAELPKPEETYDLSMEDVAALMTQIENTKVDIDERNAELEKGAAAYQTARIQQAFLQNNYTIANLVTGVDAEEGEMFTNKMDAIEAMHQMGGYNATKWKAYSDAQQLAQMAEQSGIQDVDGYVAQQGKKMVADYEEAIPYLQEIIRMAKAGELGEVTDAEISNVERELARVERELKSWEYYNLQNNADFESVLAEPAPEVKEKSFLEMYTEEYQKATNPYINQEINYTSEMTQEEKDIHEYLKRTQGKEAADAYYDFLANDTFGVLPVRASEKNKEMFAEATKSSPFLANVLAVAVSPFQIAGTLYAVGQAIKGEEINPYNVAFLPTDINSTIKFTTKEEITKALGEGTAAATIANLFYDAGIASAESLFNSAMVGGVNLGSDAAKTVLGRFGLKFSENLLAASPMGLSAAGATIQSATMAGADREQAMWMGGAAFFAETITESVTYGNIKNSLNLGKLDVTSPENVKAFLKTLAGDMMEEGGGEAMSELIGTWSDDLIMQELSQRESMIEYYMANENMTREAAEEKADRDILGNIMYAGLTGMLSPTFSSTLSYMNGRGERRAKKKANEAAENAPKETSVETPKADAEAAETAPKQGDEGYVDRFDRPAEESAPQQGEEGYVDRFDRPAEEAVAETDGAAYPTQQDNLAEGVAESAETAAKAMTNPLMNKVAALQSTADANDASRVIAIAAALQRENGTAQENSVATAAAQHLGVKYGASESTQMVAFIMSHGKNLDAETVQTAIITAALGEGQASKLMEQMMSGEVPVRASSVWMLTNLAANDMRNPAIAKHINEVATDNRIANKEVQIVGNGALAGVSSQETSYAQSEANKQEARKSHQEQVRLHEAAVGNVKSLVQQQLNNPSDTSLAGQVASAIKTMEGQSNMVKEYAKGYENAKTAAQNAKKNLEVSRETAMTQVRQQAQQEVAAEQQAEQQAKAEDELQAEQQREADNVVEMATENYLEENGYGNVTEEDKNLVRQEMKKPSVSKEGRDNINLLTQVSKRFGVKIRLVDSNVAEGAYAADSNTIYVSKNATQSEVFKRVLAHELTHRAEGTKAYQEFVDAVLDIAYKGDKEKIVADLNAIYEQYKDVYGKEQGNAIYTEELIAHVAGELLSDTDAISRIVADKPSVARRMLDTIRNFINRIKGVNDPFVDQLRKVEKLMTRALEESDRKYRKSLSDMGIEVVDENAVKYGLKYFLGASGKENAGEQYSYQYLTSLPDMKISKMPNQNEFFKSERVSDRKLSSELGITNAKSKDGTISTSRHIFVNNTYSGIPIQINESGLRHGINGARDRRARNSAAAVIAGDLIENAVPINELEKKDGEKPYVKKVFLYVGMAEDENNFYPVGMVVKSTEEDLGELSGIEAFEGVDKRYLYSLNAASENKKGTAYEGMAVSDTTSSGSNISISDLLELVKNKFGDGFSSDVLNNLGIERPEGQYGKNAKYALPSSSLLNYQINNWRNASEQQDAEPQPRQRERQFAGQTMPNSNAPGEAVQALLNDPQQLYYTPTTNREQVNAAYTRIQAEGFDAAVERVLNLDKMNASDNADAYTLLAMAKDMGDVPTFIELARKVNVEGTEQGRALQIRTLFKRMTPTGIQVWAAGRSESGLADWMAKNQPAMKDINQRAEEVADAVRDLDSRDATEQLLALPDATITPENARWKQPVNEQQLALIKIFGLEKVHRPGINYNRATRKQRMLEAILATPNALEMTGNGLNLIQRLELLKHGVEVITVADLRYIAGNMESFMALEDEDSRQADIYLSRIYEAYGNVIPVTKKERRRTWRYTSMLLSLTSAERNIIGNALQNVDNAVAHGVATVIDKGVSKITGKRTTATISMQDRAEGWHQFVEETKNTFRDYFVDKAITRRGEDRFNTNQRGRVFQNRLGETMRLVEGYLMTVGDRNFWKKAYFNSIAEQQRVAELNGVEFNIEQAIERAEQEANYATFNEDSKVRKALQDLKQAIPMLDYIIPFTGTPTNIIHRMYQFTPFSLATNMVKHATRAMRGENFDQYQFVNDMSRGLVGSMKFAGGMALAMFGIIKMGTGDEEDEKVAGVESAQGKPYSFYITLGDQNYDLSVLAPVASPLIMGAAAYEIFKDDENALNALYSAAIAMSDQILEASYMSNVKNMFQGFGSPTENIVTTLVSNIVGQNIPAFIGQIASALDPYVRDTKDKDYIIGTLKTVMNKIPFLREMLPEKVDVAGRSVENTDKGWKAFVDPMNRTNVIDDPALNELMRLNEATGTSSFMPSDALSGTKNTLSGYDGTLNGEQKETYKKRYGELWRLGGTTYDADGNKVMVTGVTDLINSQAYKDMTDAEKANAISGVVSSAKTGAAYEIAKEAGLTKKASSSSTSDSYKKKAVRPMPERYEGKTDGVFGKLSEMYDKTGDGAFIPKGVAREFDYSNVHYDLTDAEYEKFQKNYDAELEKRLKDIDWNAPEDEIAQDVEKAYTNAAKAAKNKLK